MENTKQQLLNKLKALFDQIWHYYLDIENTTYAGYIHCRACELHWILEYADFLSESCLEKVADDFADRAADCWEIRQTALSNK